MAKTDSILDYVAKDIEIFPDGLDLSTIQESVSKADFGVLKSMNFMLKKFPTDRYLKQTILKIWFGIFFDQTPGTPVHNFVLKFFETHESEVSELFSTMIDTVIIKEFSNQNRNCQESNMIQKAGVVFANLQILLQKFPYEPTILLSLVFDFIDKAKVSENCNSDNFAKRVEFFQKAFELAIAILKVPNYRVIPDSANGYLEIICSILNLQEPFPFSVQILASRTVILLFIKFTPESTSNQAFNQLIQYSNNFESDSKISSLLLSAFLMEYKPEFSLFNLRIIDQVEKVVRSWPTTTDSDYVYYTAFLYFNLVKYMKNFDEKTNAVIRRAIKIMLRFAKNNWFHRSIEFIFKLTVESLKILSHDENFDDYVKNELYSSFQSHCEKSIFKFLHVVSEAIDLERFQAIFGNLLRERSLIDWLVDFILPSQVPNIDNSENGLDMVPANQDSHSNMDFVLFTDLRWRVIESTQMAAELICLFESHPKESLFFLNFIVPKLLNIGHSKKLLIFVLKIGISELFLNFNQNVCLALLRLNRQKSVNFLGLDERQFIQKFVIRLDPFSEDDLRIQTLALLIEHRKLAAPLTETELDLIYRLFVTCENFQHAYGRDQLVKLFKKLFWRMINGSKSDDERSEIYQRFLQKILNRCVDDLRLDKYYGTLLVHLQILKLYLEMFDRIDIQKDPSPELISMLQHSFEEIRITAKMVLVECWHRNIFNISPEKLNFLGDCHQSLLKSIQPRQARTGVVLGQLLVSLKPYTDHDLFLPKFNAMEKIVKKLNQRVEEINVDLMASAGPSPIYPLLSMLRALLTMEMDFSLLKNLGDEKKSKCVQLFEKIISGCMAACSAVSPVVCNDSPEGHLPMEIAPCGGEVRDLQTASQKLLYNGWMTIKESVLIISQIIGELADHRLGFVSCTLARTVIDFLYENQLNLVHRGAFEQCSYGFNRLVRSIWHNECLECRRRIGEILDEIRSRLFDFNIENNQHGKIVSVTRRSAGLPLVVQAILGGDPKFQLFSDFIKSLLTFIDSPSQKIFSWQVIHSLNILKSLVQDSGLARAVDPCIEAIFKVTLLWFDPNTCRHCLHGDSNTNLYSIRNSASMLLNALIIRVFGVKRNRADTNRKNRMSSLIFFRNYPSLYSLFIEKLDVSNEDRKTEPFSYYPVLIIVSKLTLSISQQTVFDATKFLMLLERLIYHCPDARIRQLSVQTYVKLSPYQNYRSVLSDLSQKLDHIDSSLSASNYLHGLALLLAEMTRQSMMVMSDLPDMHKNGDLLMVIYDKLNEFFKEFAFRKVHSALMLSLFQSHYRIRSMVQFFPHGQPDFCSKLFLSIGTHGENTATVEFFIDVVLHSIAETNNENAFDNMLQILSLKCCYEAKLAVLHLINELLILTSCNPSNLLRRSNLEYAFMDSIREAIWIARKLCDHNASVGRNQFFKHILIRKLVIPYASREINLFLENHDSEPLFQFDAHLDIVSELFCLVFNARKLNFIENIEVLQVKRFEESLNYVLRQGQVEKRIRRFAFAVFVIHLADKGIEAWEKFNLFSLIQKLYSSQDVGDRLVLLHCLKYCIQWIEKSSTESARKISFLFDILISSIHDEDICVRKLSTEILAQLCQNYEIDEEGIVSAQQMWTRLFIAMLQQCMDAKKAPWIFAKLIVDRFQDSLVSLADHEDPDALFEAANQNVDELAVLEDMMAELARLVQTSRGQIRAEIVKQILVRGAKINEELKSSINDREYILSPGTPQQIQQSRFLCLINLHFSK